MSVRALYHHHPKTNSMYLQKDYFRRHWENFVQLYCYYFSVKSSYINITSLNVETLESKEDRKMTLV